MFHNFFNTQSMVSYLSMLFRTGLRSIPGNFAKMTLTALYWAVTVIQLAHISAPTENLLDKLTQPILFVLVLTVAICLFVLGVIINVTPSGAVSIPLAFLRAHITNSVGEPPLVMKRRRSGTREVIEVFTRGIPKSKIQENLPALESALNARITKIEEGRDNQHILLHLAPGDERLPDRAYLPSGIQTKLSEIQLGVSLDGSVIADLNRTPHILAGGSTGSGKTTLLKTIICQLLDKKLDNGEPAVDVTLIDMKGGQDYPPQWCSNVCNFTSDAEAALRALSSIVGKLRQRQNSFKMMSDWKNAVCANIDDYNRLCPTAHMRREVVVIDELTELTDTTGMDKQHKELANAIIANLSTIARLGRSFGINLIIGIQRPDATAVPGQIKNNMDYRCCGKADNTLSIIVLDNGDAADQIPKDSQGLFINHEGTLFRVYLPDEAGGDTPVS